MDHAYAYAKSKPELLMRLRRIEGQVRGIQKMIEDDRYCVDILVQLAAVKSATQQVGLAILEAHTHTCVVDAIANDNHRVEKIDELMDVIRKFAKS